MPPRTKETSIKKGDKIQAKWSGSNIYYDATVLETGTKLCRVLFEDGSVHSVKPSDIKAAAKSRSTSRSRSTRGRSRSSSAGRKPAPSRSRSRSPARKSRTPASKGEKKTPSKTEKESNSVVEKSHDKEVTITVMKNFSSSVSTETSNDKRYFSKKEVVSERQEGDAKLLSDTDEPDKGFLKNIGASLRTSARIAAVQMAKTKAEEVESTPKTNAVPKSSKSFSDDESEEEEEDELDGERPVEHRWFWIVRAIGTLLQIILMPAIVVGLYSACPKRQCTILEVPRLPQRLSSYLDPTSGLVLVSFALLQAILFIIPIGKEVPGFPFGGKSTVFKYRPLNGLISLLVTIILICTLGYFDISLNFGCDKFFPLMITSIIFSFLLSVMIHIKSRWALPHLRNPKGDTGSTLSDFFVGREINPRIGQKFDVKLYAFRFGMSAWAVLLICCLYKAYFTKLYLDIPLFLVAGMQMFYILTTTLREQEVYLSSATFTSDGLGYQMILGAFTVIPFVNTIQPLYLVNHGTKATTMPHWCSAAVVALFLCGYFISLKSSNVKYEFRRNPYSPKLSHVESIPTSKKKRLIISGWWGIIRHPNYLGDLIMCIAWTLPCGFNHFIPFCPLIFSMILFVVRAIQVDAECKEKYGPAWQCYAEKVRSRIIPYIF